MKNNLILINLSVMLIISGLCSGHPKKSAVNYLGIQSPVSFQSKAFQLVWSSHPDASLYKQEYLQSGDAFPNYKSMIMIDFVITASTVDQAINMKIRELEQLKLSNHDVNFEIISNAATGEKIIDCLIGQTAADERNSLVERDIYRFKSVKAKSGEKGVFLFAVSTRKYGRDIKPFLTKLKTERPILIKEIAGITLPVLNIAQSN